MASNRGYTTATKVRDVMAGKVITYITDAMIESMINRIEGVIDTKMGIGAGTNSQATFTWTATNVRQWVLEGAATYGAALQASGPSAESWNTLEQLVDARNLFSYMLKFFMDIIDSPMFSDRVSEDV